MNGQDLRLFMEHGHAAQSVVNETIAAVTAGELAGDAYAMRGLPLEAWHRFAVQIELRARTLRASIRAHDESSPELCTLIDVLEIAAEKLRRALEQKKPALTKEQHNAFPRGRWNGGAR